MDFEIVRLHKGKRLRPYLRQTSPSQMLPGHVLGPQTSCRRKAEIGFWEVLFAPRMSVTDIFGCCSFWPGPDLSLSFWSYPPFVAFRLITALECIYISALFPSRVVSEQTAINIHTHIHSILITGGLLICKFTYFLKIYLQPQKPHLECCWSHSWARACAE